VSALTQPGAIWFDGHGGTQPLVGKNILIVAPYNAQVNDFRIACAIPELSSERWTSFRAKKRPWSSTPWRLRDLKMLLAAWSFCTV